MKKQTYVKDIDGPDIEVRDFFLVTAKNTSLTRENRKFLSLTLRDRTGSIEGRVWEEDAVDRLGPLFEKGDIVYVDSRTSFFQGKAQLKIRNLRKVLEELPVEGMGDFYRASDRSTEELHADYSGLLAELKNPHLSGLFALLNGEERLIRRYFTFPASVGVHHVYIGGLLEHSLSVARMGAEVAVRMGADRDIVIAGGLLHDIGKIEEMETRGGFVYSDRGRLLGHISLGVILLEGLTGRLEGFPPEIADVLAHIIISHHGAEEFGSPRKPMCIEALVVHYLDNLDAKVAGVREHMLEKMEDERWSEYHRLYESRFYRVPG